MPNSETNYFIFLLDLHHNLKTSILMKLFTGQTDPFANRHNGIVAQEDLEKMLKTIGTSSVDELINKTVPSAIRMQHSLKVSEAVSEQVLLKNLKKIASKNKSYKSFIGTIG